MDINELLYDKEAVLVYVHDPMCSWCWGFRPVHDELMKGLADNIRVVRLLGGLAPDSDIPMPEDMRHYLRDTWKKIQEYIPGTEFNFDFWDKCEPRRSTYPACRAVIAAREQGAVHDDGMTRAIQHAYYRQSKNPSDASTLIEIAESLGLDRDRFAKSLGAEETNLVLHEEMDLSRQLGVQGFPSLVLLQNGRGTRIRVDHNDSVTMLEEISGSLVN